MSTRCYDTDLNDAAWAWIAPYLPAARSGGRPRTTDLRAVLNAIFYLLRTGCQWRLLPREFPRPGPVYHYFRAWKDAGVLAELQRRDASHYDHRLEDDHWEQPGNLFRKMTPEQKQLLFDNTARALNGASQEVLERHVANCRRADPAYGDGVARALKLNVAKAA